MNTYIIFINTDSTELLVLSFGLRFMKEMGSYDYIIVGGGAAGCVLANRLSENPKNTVLLLEAGKDEKWIWTKIPVGYLYCINNPRTDWCYKTEAEAGLNGRSIIYARGKGLGGSTLINAMLYLRGQARDYDEWAELSKDDIWSWENCFPVFKEVEDSWRGNNENHSSGGEWRVEQQRLSWEILDHYAAAAEQAGIPVSSDFNEGNNFGVSKFDVNQKRGTRWSSARGFIDPIRKRPNLTIMAGVLSDKLVLENKQVKGVEFIQGVEQSVVTANKEVILSAGAIGSPAILQRSGIGDPSALNQLNIPVKHELTGVGKNLQDHLQLRTVFKVEGVKTLNQTANSLWGKAMMGLEYAINRSGPLTMAPSQLGLFAYSDDSVATPDLEFHIQPLSLDKFGDPLHSFPAVTASVLDLRPQSRGTVTIADNNPRSAPKIAPNYLSHEADRIKSVKALRLTRDILKQSALAPYKPEEFLPGIEYQTDEELMHAAGDVGTTIFHPVGTCKMGEKNDQTAVTDSRLRVRGLSGLRVIDASVMPTITSGNTSSPTIMLATRGAKMILEDQFDG